MANGPGLLTGLTAEQEAAILDGGYEDDLEFGGGLDDDIDVDELTGDGGLGAIASPALDAAPAAAGGPRRRPATPGTPRRALGGVRDPSLANAEQIARLRAEQRVAAEAERIRAAAEVRQQRRAAAQAQARSRQLAAGGGSSGLTLAGEETARFTQLLTEMGQGGITLVADIFNEARKDDRSDVRPNANVNMGGPARAAAAKAFLFSIGSCLGANGEANFDSLKTGKYEVNMKKVGMHQRKFVAGGEAILAQHPALAQLFNMTYLLIARKFGRPKMALLRRAIVGSEVIALSEDKGKERRIEELLKIKGAIAKAIEAQGMQGVDPELFMNAVFLSCSMVIGRPAGSEGRLGGASSRKVKHMAGMVYALQLVETQAELLKDIPAPVANTLVRSNIIATGQVMPCLLWALYAPADPSGEGVPDMVKRAYENYKFHGDMGMSCKMYTLLEAINDSQAKMSNELRLARVKPGYTAKVEGKFKDLLKIKEMAGSEGVTLDALGAWAAERGWNFSKE